jgi:ABC-type multidrug transport system ATPase subunit
MSATVAPKSDPTVPVESKIELTNMNMNKANTDDAKLDSAFVFRTTLSDIMNILKPRLDKTKMLGGANEDEMDSTTTYSLEDVISALDALYTQASAPAPTSSSTSITVASIDATISESSSLHNLEKTFSTVDKATKENHVPVELSWSDVQFTVGKKHILRGCSGTIRPGDLCAIMGPSGAGKSTLMNILAGRTRTTGGNVVKGTIKANGRIINPIQFRKNIAYVLQEDSLFATQTPREAFYFSAKLRLPSAVSNEQIQHLVEAMLSALSLNKCANTYIGGLMVDGISGGEKKRTSIGIELISNPSILFLDEPTSGLDSFAAYTVVQILKRLSRSGRTIITTIHQPSSEVFSLFDDVLLLASGRVVYHDTTKDLPQYFEKCGHRVPLRSNPADFVIFLMQTHNDLETLSDEWDIYYQKMITTTTTTKTKENSGGGGGGGGGSGTVQQQQVRIKKGSCCVQFQMLTVRESRNIIRDKKSLAARFGSTIFLNLLVAILFQGAANWKDVGSPEVGPVGGSQHRIALAFKARAHFGVVVQLFISAMMGMAQPAMLTFPLERPVVEREFQLNTYNSFAYLFSKLLVEIPLTFAQAFVSMCCCYWLIGLNANFFLATTIAALLGMVAGSLALTIGAMVSSAQEAMQFTPVLFVPQFLFSGVFIPLADIPEWIRWPQYLCFLKYALNVAFLAEFESKTYYPNGWNTSLPDALFQETIFGCSGDDLNNDLTCVNSDTQLGNALFPTMDIDPGLKWAYYGIMLGSLLVLRSLALCCLVRQARK